ncbi:hypothetical protein LC040_09240 [Bacillus tianshenii]|nr:hypothetical protein LC040_09240 [Bacillus tianshenii]
MGKDIKEWMDKLERERAQLEALKTDGTYTNEHDSRLNYIEAMLDQVIANQNLRSSQL